MFFMRSRLTKLAIQHYPFDLTDIDSTPHVLTLVVFCLQAPFPHADFNRAQGGAHRYSSLPVLCKVAVHTQPQSSGASLSTI